MQPLQICIGPSIRIGRESWCLPYVGFFFYVCQKDHLKAYTQALKSFKKAPLGASMDFRRNTVLKTCTLTVIRT